MVLILSRKTGKPLPRWVHRRSRGEGQYGRRSCGTLDIQSAFCEPGKVVNWNHQHFFAISVLMHSVWDLYKKGSHRYIISFSYTFTAVTWSWLGQVILIHCISLHYIYLATLHYRRVIRWFLQGCLDHGWYVVAAGSGRHRLGKRSIWADCRTLGGNWQLG